MSAGASSRGDESDGEIDDEDRLAAALAVLARRGADGAPALARWRRRRLAALAASPSDDLASSRGVDFVAFRSPPITVRGSADKPLD
jgi:hypothetical protein